MKILGIDIGGTGIKAAPVDAAKGTLLEERRRIRTPNPSTPEAVSEVVAKLVHRFNWKGPIGCTFPAIIKDGVVFSAANVDQAWVGTNGQVLLEQKTNCPVTLVNDGDAAGIAEMQFGAGKGHNGIVIVLTFGTGIGSAIFHDGKLLPNTELGHLEIRGKDAERRAAARVREDKGLSFPQWAERVDEYLQRVEFLFSPDLFIFGGGISKKHKQFLPLLHTRTPVIPAQMFNNAGIVGAAIAALPNAKSSGEIYD
jgi:polyphosphate glucokinase